MGPRRRPDPLPAALLLVGALLGGCHDPVRACEDEGGEWIEDACWPGLSERACPAGTSPRVGAGGCVPVGHGATRACPHGFEAAADGWGCAPVYATGCQPGFKPVLGEAGCVRIDDCQRAFPPAAATIFVDDDYSAAEVDATHFASLQAAVAAAPAGAHLAIERGVYEGVLVLERPMTLEGRCAAGTLLGDLMAGWSVVVEAGVSAGLSHVSFGNYAGGIQVREGGSLDASHLYLGQVGSLGLAAFGPGAVLRAREVVIQDTLPGSDGSDGIPVLARGGGTVSLSEGWIHGYYQGAGVAFEAGSRVTFERVIAERGFPGGSGTRALAMLADAGGRIEARTSLFRQSGQAGFHLDGEGTLLLAEEVIVHDLAELPSGTARGRVLEVYDGAEAQISGFTFRSGGDVAVLVSKGRAFLDTGVIRGATTAGGVVETNAGAAVTAGGELGLTDVALLEQAADAVVALGPSVLVAREILAHRTHIATGEARGIGLAVMDGATGRVEDYTVWEAGWVGVQTAGAGSRLEAERLGVIGTRPVSETQRGLGLLVHDAGTLLLSESRVRGTDGLGLTVGHESGGVSTGGAAGVEHSILEDNTVGLNTQGIVALEVVEGLPAQLPPDRLLVSEDTLFRENLVRIASERVVLPSPPSFSP
ncbi:MAG: hypothetical protein P1V51_20535 [Deltaproteobacteria bacterium]|nr:hypothetical protein [Deltaproteobacteria bacterium]